MVQASSSKWIWMENIASGQSDFGFCFNFFFFFLVFPWRNRNEKFHFRVGDPKLNYSDLSSYSEKFDLGSFQHPAHMSRGNCVLRCRGPPCSAAEVGLSLYVFLGCIGVSLWLNQRSTWLGLGHRSWASEIRFGGPGPSRRTEAWYALGMKARDGWAFGVIPRSQLEKRCLYEQVGLHLLEREKCQLARPRWSFPRASAWTFPLDGRRPTPQLMKRNTNNIIS